MRAGTAESEARSAAEQRRTYRADQIDWGRCAYGAGLARPHTLRKAIGAPLIAATEGPINCRIDSSAGAVHGRHVSRDCIEDLVDLAHRCMAIALALRVRSRPLLPDSASTPI